MAVVLKSADKMNKAELVSLVKTLRKRIAKLEGMKAAPPPLHPDGLPVVTHVEPGEDTVSDLVDEPAPCAAFPWEKK